MNTLEIFKKVRQYLDHEISLRELEDWLVPSLSIFLSRPVDTARELAGIIELGLAEMSSSQISEEEFRHLVEEFLQNQSYITML